MASPVGHAALGLASAAVAARVVGVDPSPGMWLGAFIGSGLPDLDLALYILGFRGPHIHRNATHSLLAITVLAVGLWFSLPFVGVTIPAGLWVVWTVAVLSHPLADVITAGPEAAGKGFGVSLLWPISQKRWFMQRPVLECADFAAIRSARDVWLSIRLEVLRLVPPSILVIAVTLLL